MMSSSLTRVTRSIRWHSMCSKHRARPSDRSSHRASSPHFKSYGAIAGARGWNIYCVTVCSLSWRREARPSCPLSRLLTDTAYRNQLTGRLHDPLVRNFWHNDFAHWKPQLKAEAVSPVLNKVGAFLSSPILRAIVGQPHSTLKLREILDERKILIVNLSKGRMGEDASSLLGSLLVTGLQLAAMSRADRPEADRGSPFFLVVDEFQNLATSAFATILSEARKYRLGLTLSHQFLEQVDEPTLAAIFGNVGSLCAFGVGARGRRSARPAVRRRASAAGSDRVTEVSGIPAIAHRRHTVAAVFHRDPAASPGRRC